VCVWKRIFGSNFIAICLIVLWLLITKHDCCNWKPCTRVCVYGAVGAAEVRLRLQRPRRRPRPSSRERKGKSTEEAKERHKTCGERERERTPRHICVTGGNNPCKNQLRSCFMLYTRGRSSAAGSSAPPKGGREGRKSVVNDFKILHHNWNSRASF